MIKTAEKPCAAKKWKKKCNEWKQKTENNDVPGPRHETAGLDAVEAVERQLRHLIRWEMLRKWGSWRGRAGVLSGNVERWDRQAH